MLPRVHVSKYLDTLPPREDATPTQVAACIERAPYCWVEGTNPGRDEDAPPNYGERWLLGNAERVKVRALYTDADWTHLIDVRLDIADEPCEWGRFPWQRLPLADVERVLEAFRGAGYTLREPVWIRELLDQYRSVGFELDRYVRFRGDVLETYALGLDIGSPRVVQLATEHLRKRLAFLRGHYPTLDFMPLLGIKTEQLTQTFRMTPDRPSSGARLIGGHLTMRQLAQAFRHCIDVLGKCITNDNPGTAQRNGLWDADGCGVPANVAGDAQWAW